MMELSRFYELQESGCWIFRSPNNGSGFCINVNGKKINPRKIFFEQMVGVLLEEKILFEDICGNKNCVNPEHIKLRNPAIECKHGHFGKIIKTKKMGYDDRFLYSCKACNYQRRMEKKYVLICDVCKKEFKGNHHQKVSKKNGNQVTCSDACKFKTAWVRK